MAALLLPRVLDFAAARTLWDSLDERRGEALVLDASEVERVSGLCLQVLIAGNAEWRQAGISFRICSASPAFAEALKTMGANALLAEAA